MSTTAGPANDTVEFFAEILRFARYDGQDVRDRGLRMIKIYAKENVDPAADTAAIRNILAAVELVIGEE